MHSIADVEIEVMGLTGFKMQNSHIVFSKNSFLEFKC